MAKKITQLDDYRTTSRYSRAVKKQSRDRIVGKLNKFLDSASVFFNKADSERGKKLITDLDDGDN